MKKNVIVNADDFGRSRDINAAVLRAYREGVLTSASLMAGGEAFDEAVEIARENPGLSVGLHVVAVAGRPVLPPERISRIVDRNGRLPATPVRCGLAYQFSGVARTELRDEITAQFHRFAATSLPLSHVDGHLHMHMHPAVFDLVVALAKEAGANGIRIPRDEVGLALRHDLSNAMTKIGWSIAFRWLSWRALRRLAGSGLAVADRVYGLMQTGNMEERYVLKLLDRIPDGATAELYFHPSLRFEGEALGPNRGDFSTLISPTVRDRIAARGLTLESWASLAAGGAG